MTRAPTFSLRWPAFAALALSPACWVDQQFGDDTDSADTGVPGTSTGDLEPAESSSSLPGSSSDSTTDASSPDSTTHASSADSDSDSAEDDSSPGTSSGSGSESSGSSTGDVPVEPECTAHDQCPDARGCDLANETCIAGPVLYVDGLGPGCPADGTGTEANPFCLVTEAFNAVGPGGSATIRIAENTVGYDSSSVDEGELLAMLAWEGTPRMGHLYVSGADTVVYLDGLHFEGNYAGLQGMITVEAAATLWADRTNVVLNAAVGVFATGGADVHLRTCIIGGNSGGNGFMYGGGIYVDNATLSMEYTTVARNDWVAWDSLRCSSATSVVVRDSILIGRGPESINCPGVDMADSAIDQDMAGNTNVGTGDPSWFVDAEGGDFHLSAAGQAVFADLATWNDGDPVADIDGDARPKVDGAPDYPGADVP